MSVKKQSRPQKQSKPAKQAEPPEPSPPKMDFDAAVARGKLLVTAIKSNEWELGRLADRVKPELLAKLAKEIEISLDRLNRCRSTFRAYKGTPFEESTPPNFNFGAAQALQADPERVSILQAKPDMATAKARGIARANKAAKGKKPPPKSRNDAGAIRAAQALAVKVHSEIGHVKPEHINAEILRDEIKNPEQTDKLLRRAGKAFFDLADIWKGKLESLPAPVVSRLDMWTDTKPAEATKLADATLEPAE